MALGEPEDRATEMASAIVDWRTAVSPTRQSPFDAFYLAESPSFLPPHTSFHENEELLLVKGITPDLYYGASLNPNRAGLRDCVSVYGTTGPLDINTARAETIIAAGIAAEDAATIVRSRAEHPVLHSRNWRHSAIARTGGKSPSSGRRNHVHIAGDCAPPSSGRKAFRSPPYRVGSRQVQLSGKQDKETSRIRDRQVV